MYRIILVDDHAIVREGFRALIEREPDLSIIAECESLFDMEAALATLEPDLLVLDLSLGDGGGSGTNTEFCAGMPWSAHPGAEHA